MPYSSKLCTNDILFRERGLLIFMVLPCHFISIEGKRLLIAPFSRSTGVMEPRAQKHAHHACALRHAHWGKQERKGTGDL